MSQASSDVTQILHEARDGDERAQRELWEAVYDEVARMARYYLARERQHHTMSTVDLVSEAYLKMVKPVDAGLNSREHFFAVAARAMRQVLVDYARQKQTLKRGGNVVKGTLDEGVIVREERLGRLVELDDLLEQLEKFNPRYCRVLECEFFAQMTQQETAKALGVSTKTIQRDRAKALALLRGLDEQAGNGHAAPGDA